MCFLTITTKYNRSLEAAQAYIIDDDRYEMFDCAENGQPNPNSTSSGHIPDRGISFMGLTQSIRAVQLCFRSIVTKYNGSLEAALAFLTSLDTTWLKVYEWPIQIGPHQITYELVVSLLSLQSV